MQFVFLVFAVYAMDAASKPRFSGHIGNVTAATDKTAHLTCAVVNGSDFTVSGKKKRKTDPTLRLMVKRKKRIRLYV